MSEDKIRVVLVDDHQMLRDGLKLLIDGEADMITVGEAQTGEESIAVVIELQPDVVVMDLGMPGRGGLEAIRELRGRSSSQKIVILTMHGEQEMITESFKAGCDGFVPKSTAHTHLLEAIRSVINGERYLHPDVAVGMMEGMTERHEKAMMLKDLSEREVEVFTLTALGYTRTKISEQLAISPKTVDTYRLRAMEKLELDNRAKLVRFALQAGILSDET